MEDKVIWTGMCPWHMSTHDFTFFSKKKKKTEQESNFLVSQTWKQKIILKLNRQWLQHFWAHPSWEYFVGSIEATLSVNCTKNQVRNKHDKEHDQNFTWGSIVIQYATPEVQVGTRMLLNICPPQAKLLQNHNPLAAHSDPSYSNLGEQDQLLNINATSQNVEMRS